MSFQESLPQDDVFYENIREWIISLTLFVVFYTFSHITLYHYTEKNEEDEIDRYYIPLVLSSISLSFCLATLLLVPLTFLTYSLPSNSFLNPYLSVQLIKVLWNHILWESHLALLCILPFAYFYYEAIGFRFKGALGRFFDAFATFSLFAVLLFGIIYFFRHIISSPTTSLSDYLRFSYSLMTFFGSLLALLSCYYGFTALFTSTFQQIVPLRRLRKERIDELIFEQRELELKLKEQNCLLNPDENNVNVQKNKERLHKVILEQKRFTNRHRLFLVCRDLVAVMLLICHVGCMVHLLFEIVLGTIWAVHLVIYLMVIVVYGFYRLPFKGIKKRTSRGIIVHVGLLVMISAGYPVMLEVLGMGRDEELAIMTRETGYYDYDFEDDDDERFEGHKIVYVTLFRILFVGEIVHSLWNQFVVRIKSKFVQKKIKIK